MNEYDSQKMADVLIKSHNVELTQDQTEADPAPAHMASNTVFAIFPEMVSSSMRFNNSANCSALTGLCKMRVLFLFQFVANLAETPEALTTASK